MLGILPPVSGENITMIHKLLKTQFNDVLKTLKNAGLNPGDFEWIERVVSKSESFLARGDSRSDKYPKLRLKRHAQYYFQFEVLGREHSCTYAPGADFFKEQECSGDWNGQLQAVYDWAVRLREEIEAPDLWMDWKKYQITVSPDVPDNVLNEVISASEAEDISKKLEMLGDQIQEVYNLTSEQDRFVRGKLNFLEDAAKRSRTVEWMFMALSVFQIIAMGLTLTPEQIQQLTGIIKTIFGNFINLIG